MIGSYQLLTVTHKHIPLGEIQHYVLDDDGGTIKDRLLKIQETFGLSELYYLTTCNRVLFFWYRSQPLQRIVIPDLLHAINPQYHSTYSEEKLKKVKFWSGEQAIRHLFEIGASIDSLVIGEREILHQMKESFHQCQKWGFIGPKLRMLMEHSIKAAKKVYGKTGISQKSVSVVSLAVNQLLERNPPRKAKVVMIGAGQTNKLFAKFLKKYGFETVSIYNRTTQNAKKLAKIFEFGEGYNLNKLGDSKLEFDILIICTAVPGVVLTYELYRDIVPDSKSKKILIDLAIPHNVDKNILGKFDVDYIELESLKEQADENLNARKREVVHAHEWLDKQLMEFYEEYQTRNLQKAISSVPEKIKGIRKHAQDHVFAKELNVLSPEAQILVDRILDYMEKRCISVPMKAIKEIEQS